MTEILKSFLNRVGVYTDNGLGKYIPSESSYPQSIHKAMRYSVFAGGKRLRPALALASYELCGGEENNESVLMLCCALEMLHTFSLIHDDLPAMDDDDFRRGKPTSHKQFGEATAILAGDALCIQAFELLSKTKNCEIISTVSDALGTSGMIGGQVVDIESEGKSVDKDVLNFIHTHKTGKLIKASTITGAMIANASKSEIGMLLEYGKQVGLAFQIADDILDVTGSTEQIGKDAGSDQAKGKATYPSIYGLEESKSIAKGMAASAKDIIKPFGNKAELLCDIADYTIERIK